MNLEHRLQHAARDLREIPIDVPPLGQSVRRRRLSLVPALAAPLLFASGALFAAGAARGVEHPVHSDVSTVVEPATEPDADRSAADARNVVAGDSGDSGDSADNSAPSIRAELELRSELIRINQPAIDSSTPLQTPHFRSLGPI